MQSVLEQIDIYDISDMANPRNDEKRIGLASVLLIIGLIVGGVWGLHFEFTRVFDRIGDVDKHISRVETAVRVIAAKQGGDIKDLVDAALTIAANKASEGNHTGAEKAVAIANRLLDEQKNARLSVPPDFFQQSLQKYQQLRLDPNLASTALQGKRILAEYRSALNTVPPEFASKAPAMTLSAQHLEIRNGQFIISNAYLSGRAIDNSGGQGFDIDGAILENVVLENMRIVYRGGPVTLRGVRFINCTFSVPQTPQADRLLEAAIQNPSVNLG